MSIKHTPIIAAHNPDCRICRRFTLDWVCLNDLSFDGIKDVPAHLGKGRRAVAVMDGQEICSESGYELLRAYSDEHRRSPCRIE